MKNDQITIITQSELPNTWKKIKAEFSGTLRAFVWESARMGNVLGIASDVALTSRGIASLNAVQEVLTAEFAEKGFSRVHVGWADPSQFGPGNVAAYMDQPL